MGKHSGVATALVGCICLCLSIAGNGNPDKRTIRIKERRELVSAKLIETAYQYEGLQEITGSNDHPQIQAWLKQTGLIGQYAWCAAAMAGIHEEAGVPHPNSARVVDWFKTNVVWKKEFGKIPEFTDIRGMVGAIYYRRLGRYGHIVMIVGEDKNNYYTVEGNTSPPSGNASENVVREGEGFFRKVRSKEYIAALADYCVSGSEFLILYDNYLQKMYNK